MESKPGERLMDDSLETRVKVLEAQNALLLLRLSDAQRQSEHLWAVIEIALTSGTKIAESKCCCNQRVSL